jgi:hypothetical protein
MCVNSHCRSLLLTAVVRAGGEGFEPCPGSLFTLNAGHMASTQIKQKGRPATGSDPLVGVRMPAELIAELDDWAAENALTRSDAVRKMVLQRLTPKQAVRERPPQLVAIGLGQDARSYLQAAQATDAIHGYQYFPPTYFLLAHSMELILKGYCSSQGVSQAKLQRLGHNLAKAYRKAVSAGYSPKDNRIEALSEWLSPFHEELDFRYRRPGQMKLPDFAESSAIVQSTIDEIEPEIRNNFSVWRNQNPHGQWREFVATHNELWAKRPARQ